MDATTVQYNSGKGPEKQQQNKKNDDRLGNIWSKMRTREQIKVGTQERSESKEMKEVQL